MESEVKMTKILGIDVSTHNGKPDWAKVKADGVKFAMIRMGIGSDISSQDDKEFERNVSECDRLGIPWGAYLYSYALNVNDAKSEVEHAKRLLKGKKPTYPIAFDMEDADGYKKKNGMPSNSTLVDICETFLSALEKEGYKVTLYASLSWLDNQLNNSKLDKYDKWVAQWGPKCTYGGEYSLWQYTSDGEVNGIDGRVDLNYSYKDFAAKSVSETKKETKKEVKKEVKSKTATVKTYQVTKQHNGYATANDAKYKKNKKTTVPKGKYYVFNESQGMINVTTKKGVPGSWINPSETSAKATNPEYYVVKNNDNLTKIAKEYKTSVASILALNPSIKNKNLIYPKQKIRVK